jgi:hypothetical protein
MTPGLVSLADDLAKPQPPLLHLLDPGSHLLLGRRSLFSSRLHLCPRRHRCLRLQLIAERSKVLKLSKRGLERQGRPSRETPTPPRYGYLTRHLPRKATHARLSGSASRQASPSAQNEEETRLHAQIPRCSGLDSHNEQTQVLRVPLQTELWFHSRGYELPPHQRACGTTNSGWLTGNRCTNSAATTSISDAKTAAATTSGRTLPLEGPRSRPLTGDENQPLKPKSRRSDRRWRRRSRWRRNLLWLPPPQHRRQRPPAHQHRTSERRPPQSAPAGPHSRSHHENENGAVPEHEYRPRGVRHVVQPTTQGGPGRSRPARGTAVARVEDGQLHPVQEAAVRLPPHGWRTPPPQGWSMPFSPECWRKKRAADPCGR